MRDSEYEYQQWQLQGMEAEVSRLEEEVASLKEELAARAWNPVTLESPDAPVLVWTKTGTIHVAMFMQLSGKWEPEDSCDFLDVTHWMPLPDPPQA